MNDIQVSTNFKLNEFQCRCGCQQVKLSSELLERLQAMRTETGRPIRVNSGYRCPSHNRTVGGATNSQHLHGTAADIVIVGLAKAQQNALCERYFSDGGLGRMNRDG